MNRSFDSIARANSELSLHQDKSSKTTISGFLSTNSPNSLEFLLRLAENTQTPQHILERLCHRPEIELRLALTENPSTPTSTLTLLAFDRSVDVRFQLAENHNAPLSILQILESDDNPYVSWRAAKTVARMKASSSMIA